MRATFEEACKQGHAVVTAEKLSKDHVACMAERAEVLAKLGWTSRELCEEAARRMHVRIAEMKAKES